jgi:hypothetical protein
MGGADVLTPSAENIIAARAAARELRVLRAALAPGQPATALDEALQAHEIWLGRLIGCSPEILHEYIAYRRELTKRFGLMPETLQLQETESCVLTVIRRGVPAHET